MDTFEVVKTLALVALFVWSVIDRYRQAGRDLETWERAEAMRRANEYIKRHAVPRSSHPFR